jgi:hypothetical protein
MDVFSLPEATIRLCKLKKDSITMIKSKKLRGLDLVNFG